MITQRKPESPLGRAGDGNRTHTASLEGWNSTIELRPQSLQHQINTKTPVPRTPRSPIHTQNTKQPKQEHQHKPKRPDGQYWGKQDSNLRRLSHQIYSLAHLAALEFPLPLTSPNNTRKEHPKRAVLSPNSITFSLCRVAEASGGSRTHNRRFTKPELCQLSYTSADRLRWKVGEYSKRIVPDKGDPCFLVRIGAKTPQKRRGTARFWRCRPPVFHVNRTF